MKRELGYSTSEPHDSGANETDDAAWAMYGDDPEAFAEFVSQGLEEAESGVFDPSAMSLEALDELDIERLDMARLLMLAMSNMSGKREQSTRIARQEVWERFGAYCTERYIGGAE